MNEVNVFRYNKCIKDCLQALILDPGYTKVMKRLSIAYLNLG